MLVNGFRMLSPSTITYLIELRQRLLKCLLLAAGLFIVFFVYADDLFFYLAAPLMPYLQGPMLATSITSPLLVPLELAAKASLLLTLPYCFYQLWAFVSPALYKQEGRLVLWLFSCSLVLFVAGLMFCYWIVMPLLFGFFTQTLPKNVTLMPDIGLYLSLSTRFLLLFGMVFQIPILLVFLTASKLVSTSQLIAARPYVIVSAFIVGMLLTPPDVLSQILLAVPICVLYEVGVVASKIGVKRNLRLDK